MSDEPQTQTQTQSFTDDPSRPPSREGPIPTEPSNPATVPSPTGRPNPIVRHLASQFHRPRGPLGRLAGWIMATRGSGVARNRFLVDLLELEADHRVLELGSGPGLAVAAAGRVVTEGSIVAVDHSTLMLHLCADRNRDLVADGRLSLVNADAGRLPSDLVGFDRIVAMNVWHFWPDQEAVVVDLAGRLAPGGRLVLAYQPRHPGADAADADAGRRCLRDQMAEAGLTVTDRTLDLDPPVAYVIGRR